MDSEIPFHFTRLQGQQSWRGAVKRCFWGAVFEKSHHGRVIRYDHPTGRRLEKPQAMKGCNSYIRSNGRPSRQDLTDSPDTQKIKAQLVDMQGSQVDGAG